MPNRRNRIRPRRGSILGLPQGGIDDGPELDQPAEQKEPEDYRQDEHHDGDVRPDFIGCLRPCQGWHEPGTTLEFIINSHAWAELPKDLQKIVEIRQSGIYLIVFAGMEYALYVEAKGFDVLTGSRPSRAKVINTFKSLLL